MEIKMKKLFTLITTLFAFLFVACVPPQGNSGPNGNHGRENSSQPSDVENQGETDENGSNPVVEIKGKGGRGPLIDLQYSFIKGAVWKYTSVEDTAISFSVGGAPGADIMGSMGGMGMPAGLSMKSRFKSTTDFNVTIDQVNQDGSANFTMSVDSFSVYAMPGNILVASNRGLTTQDLKVTGNISSKGKILFFEDLYLVITKSKERYLVRAKLSSNGTSVEASASTQDTDVKVYAKFNPKTGMVEGGAKVTTKSKVAVPSTLKVTSEDRRMDIVPKRFMRLFRLPEGKIQAGSSTIMKAPMVKVAVTMENIENSVALLNTTFSMLDENTMPKEVSMPTMSGSAKMKFSQSAGRLLSINGKIKTAMSSGVKLTIISNLTLTARQ
jgi:hypothetical protein